EHSEGAGSEKLWFLVEWAVTLIDKIAESVLRTEHDCQEKRFMSIETVNQRHALSILFLIGSIFLVAAMWKLPSPECNADDVRRAQGCSYRKQRSDPNNPSASSRRLPTVESNFAPFN
ncbi:MAG: hypothetical protein WBW14_21035, partial [Candidatus Acidiferrum sp.]